MSEERQPTEEELRAAYEAEIKKIRVEHVLLEHVVSLVNLGMRRTGAVPGTEDERDPEQVRLAIEAVRAVVPLLEQTAPQQVGPIRQALSQLQLAYVKAGGEVGEAGGAAGGGEAGAPSGEAGAPGGEQPSPGATEQQSSPGQQGPGPAQKSGRLWVPGQ